jgi:predicted amidophosphoribosyltransferase
VPVPLHRVRRRERDYNQSSLVARSLGQRCLLPVRERLLIRHRWTSSQTGLSVQERRRNVAGCFQTTRSSEGQRALLIDDVLTTGATASACAVALKAAGCPAVAVLTVATPKKGD